LTNFINKIDDLSKLEILFKKAIIVKSIEEFQQSLQDAPFLNVPNSTLSSELRNKN